MEIVKHAYQRFGNSFMLGISLLLLLGQFASLSGMLAKNADHRSIISSIDDDAGTAIAKAVKTRWYNDNTWRPYGPVYYRLVHTIARVVPFDLNIEGLSEIEVIERAHHFAMMLVSLLSLFFVTFFFCYLLTNNLPLNIISSLYLNELFLSHEVWVRFILRAHPDLIFCFLSVMATYLTYLMLAFPQRRSFFVSAALLWGIVASTKLTIVLFVPAFIFYFVPAFDRENLKKMLRFAGLMILGYLLIGFPQNFTVHKSINFLRYQSQYSIAVTWDIFCEWLSLYSSQIYLPLVFIIFFPLSLKKKVTGSLGRRFLIVSHLPFFFLLSRGVSSPHEYYTLPFVMISLLIIILIKRHYFFRFSLKAPWTFVALLFLIETLKPHSAFNGELRKQLHCRNEVRAMDRQIRALLQSDHKILMTPYIPFTRSLEENILIDWDHTFEKIAGKDFDFLVLNSSFYSRYISGLQPNQYTLVDTKDWESTRKFYLTFAEKGEAIDPFGNRWSLVSRDQCNMELWKKIN